MKTLEMAPYYSVILGVCISEKASIIADKPRRQYIFEVLPSSTKAMVKLAVEMLFKVKVHSVQILNQAGKRKRVSTKKGGIAYKRKDKKKAYVSLAIGHEIDFENEKVEGAAQ